MAFASMASMFAGGGGGGGGVSAESSAESGDAEGGRGTFGDVNIGSGSGSSMDTGQMLILGLVAVGIIWAVTR